MQAWRVCKCAYFLEHSLLAYTSDGRTVKRVLSGHSKIDKTKILMTNGSLMKVESIAECILQYFWPALTAIIGLKNQFLVIFRVAVLEMKS